MKFYLLTATLLVLIIGCDREDNSPTEPENSYPNAPSLPSPRDKSIDRSIDIELSWSCSDPDGDSLKYDVYFGTNYEPPMVAEDQIETTFDPGELEYRKTYYWKIGAKDDDDHRTEGKLWSFRTIDDLSDGVHAGERRVFFLNKSSVSITMIWIPPGSFMMGAQDDEQDAEGNEYPQHVVTIDKGFWMGKYEVTQAQWEVVTDDNPSYFQGNNHPVETVSWDNIHDFLDQVNDGFRFPSEAEWEYACRAGSTTRFYWGDDASYEDIDDYAWFGDVQGQTHEAGQKLPNAWHLYDMSGNVMEWVEDDYHSNYNNASDDGSSWTDDPRATYCHVKHQ